MQASSEPNVTLLRPLGLFERYCLARHQAGVPVVLAWVVEVKLDSREEQRDFAQHLERRINSIVEQNALLSPADALDSASTLARQDEALPASAEHHHLMKPSLAFMLPILFKELLLPLLPTFFSTHFQRAPSWGTDAIRNGENHSDIKRRLLFFDDGNLVRDIKHHSAKHGIKTLHPVIHTAAVLAVWFLSQQQRKISGIKEDEKASAAIVVESSTPRSLRKPERDSFCSGNLIAGHVSALALNQDSPVWPLAQEYQAGREFVARAALFTSLTSF
ncbi:hypothetical protein CBOM_03512 [Ceraceosorus bombacis]|uniref:Uncharacterized protein n=1 Tax=Ceraceosorus bombacis TaxID=401625 RepID=A0A0N7L9Z7_9BASI|nr:hypothetical protein CBOM_03512 [Ceraceosorus bombacis]